MDNMAGKAQKEAEVANQMNQLDKRIAEIGVSMTSLEDRLSSVISSRGENPTPTTGIVDFVNKELVEETLVPLAEILRTYNNRLLGHNRNIQRLCRDCEL